MMSASPTRPFLPGPDSTRFLGNGFGRARDNIRHVEVLERAHQRGHHWETVLLEAPTALARLLTMVMKMAGSALPQ